MLERGVSEHWFVALSISLWEDIAFGQSTRAPHARQNPGTACSHSPTLRAMLTRCLARPTAGGVGFAPRPSPPRTKPPARAGAPRARPAAAAREPFSGTPDAAASAARVYDGAYGPWTVEPADVAEVLAYRAGLVGASLALAGGALSAQPALAPGLAAWAAVHPAASNAAVVAGAVALGSSLGLLHLYVAPLKKALLGLWAAGAVGGAVLAATHPGTPLVSLIAATPGSILAVGPLAAALTGVAIKEGLCYGKAECALLAAALPGACLAHLAGAGGGVSGPAADGAALLALLWTVRKAATQPVVEDIGDKSVFAFRALSPADQAATLARLRAAAALGVEEGEEGGSTSE